MRLALIAAFVLFAFSAAQAQTAEGDWAKGNSSRMRLIAMGLSGSGDIVAGVELQLDEGWKTYWRVPGDAGGVPPEMDFSASVNVAKTELKFPAPRRLSDKAGENIGYKHAVIFPVRVTPKTVGQPVTFDVNVLVGVCKNICIPEERHLTLAFDPKAEPDDRIVRKLTGALAALPGDASQNGRLPKVVSISVEGNKAIIEAAYPGGTDGADLFAEAPDGSYVPMAKPMDGAPDGHRRFTIDLAQADAFKAPSGKAMRFTLVSEAGAAEETRNLP